MFLHRFLNLEFLPFISKNILLNKQLYNKEDGTNNA